MLIETEISFRMSLFPDERSARLFTVHVVSVNFRFNPGPGTSKEHGWDGNANEIDESLARLPHLDDVVVEGSHKFFQQPGSHMAESLFRMRDKVRQRLLSDAQAA